jgi:hypothetical protein
MRDDLIAAVQGRRYATFTYQGFPRRVQPAAVGVDQGGAETLHAYQVDGGSKRGGLPYWRNFHLDTIEGLVVLDEVFGPNPPGYTRAPFQPVHAALDGATSSAPPPPKDATKDQVIPGVPITAEQAAKAAEQAGKVIGEAADKLGKWLRKRR